jgi:hypothetical protein
MNLILLFKKQRNAIIILNLNELSIKSEQINNFQIRKILSADSGSSILTIPSKEEEFISEVLFETFLIIS